MLLLVLCARKVFNFVLSEDASGGVWGPRRLVAEHCTVPNKKLFRSIVHHMSSITRFNVLSYNLLWLGDFVQTLFFRLILV